MRQALAIMLKAPKPGTVKTRLVPPLTFEEAAGLYACFVKDVFAKACCLEGVDVFAAIAPEGAGEALPPMPEGVSLFAQEGSDLGQRMLNVFRRLSSVGYGRASIIGTDSPDLPLEYIIRSFDCLREIGAGVVLGPAKDGGYYLIGMDKPREEVFTGIPWSTGAVLEHTLARARSAGIPVRLLPPWHDIDTADDLAFLEGGRAPETRAFLEGLGKRGGF